MLDAVKVLLTALLAYALGSIPFAILITRWAAGVDVRTQGSGHAGATNTMRAAGWPAGVAVLLLDVSKGALAVWLARHYLHSEFGAALAAGFTVIGHCWPVFAGFRGGMGMSTAGGAMLAAWPLGFVIGVGLIALASLVIRHSARANFATGLLVGPLWWAFGASTEAVAVAAATGLIIAYRATSDWNRVYKELWLDRG